MPLHTIVPTPEQPRTAFFYPDFSLEGRAITRTDLTWLSKDIWGHTSDGKLAHTFIRYWQADSHAPQLPPAGEHVYRAQLREFVQAKGLVEHGLHGAFGRAIDVLNIAALGMYSVGASNIRFPRISREDFDRTLKEELRIEDTRYDELLNHIKSAGTMQLQGGRPFYRGEVMFDGKVTWKPRTFEYVALDSLIAVGKGLHPVNRAILEKVVERASSDA